MVIASSGLAVRFAAAPAAIETSAVAGTGLDALREAIARAILSSRAVPNAVAGTAVRCRESIAGAADALDNALACAEGAGGDELIAAEIRRALFELGQIAGAVYTDDLLDRIFGRFCIGK